MSSEGRRPLIGITGARSTREGWGRYSLGHFSDYLLSDYSLAVLSAGGAPVIIPTGQDRASLEAILDRVQALVLSGGPDLHPRCYGEEPHAGLGEVDAELDRLELLAAELAVSRDLPLLGICRGIQVLNVSLGGTLHQDIPSAVPGSICHAPRMDKALNTHAVRLEPDSRLHRICGAPEIQVNSQHHQALKDLAPGLAVSGRARDGIVESVEMASRRFVIGVQWHPEGTWREDPHSQSLFRSLVRAAADASDPGR